MRTTTTATGDNKPLPPRATAAKVSPGWAGPPSHWCLPRAWSCSLGIAPPSTTEAEPAPGSPCHQEQAVSSHPLEVFLLSPALTATPFAPEDPLERKPAAWQAPPLPTRLLLPPPPPKKKANPFRPTSLGKQANAPPPNDDNGELRSN